MPSLQTKNFTFGTGTSVSTFGLLSATVARSNTAELSPLGADDVGIVFIKAHNATTNMTLPTTGSAGGVPIFLQGSRDNVDWVNVTSFNIGPTNGTTAYTNFFNPETNTRPLAWSAGADYVSTMGIVQLFPYMRLSWVGSTLTGNVATGLSAYIGEA